MRLLEIYRYGFLGLFKIIILNLLGLILIILFVTTIPLWWLKYTQKLLSSFGDVFEEVANS